MNKKEILNKFAEEERKQKQELEHNPLLQYSTTQLKKEIRRRKKEGWK